jgi:hypothetical protein
MLQTSNSISIGIYIYIFSDSNFTNIRLQKNVQSTRLTSFLLENVVPNFDRIKAVSEGAELELLRVLAELSATTGELVDEQSKMAPLFRKLIVIFCVRYID